MAKLSSHPSIVSVFQAGVAGDGRPFLVMEVCPPPTLRGRLRREPFDVAKTLEIGIQIASAVETAHRLGVVHRDIKPSNILFTEYGRAALTDFGISVPTATSPGAETAYSVAWAPPEQIRNQQVGPAADIYSLGASLWAMLTGHSPFESINGSNEYEQIQRRNLYDPIPPIGRGDVPESLEKTLQRALEKDPQKRQPSALDFARQLQQVQSELNLPRTTIDVRVDASARAKATAEAPHEGTRVASFEQPPQPAETAGKPVTASDEAPAPAKVTPGSTQYWLPLSQGSRPMWWSDPPTGSGWTNRPTQARPGAWAPATNQPMGPTTQPGPQFVTGRPPGWAPPAAPAGQAAFTPVTPGYPTPPPATPAAPLPPLVLDPTQPKGLNTWVKALLIAVVAFVVVLVLLLTLM